MSDETSAPAGDSPGVDFDALFTVDTPTSESTTPEAPTAAPSSSPPPEAPAPDASAPARGPDGKFVAKAATPESAPDAEAPDAPAAEPRPFQYRAAGETRAWEGVTEQPDGSVVVPSDKVGDLRAALNARVLAEGQLVPVLEKSKAEVQRLTGEVQRLTQERSSADVKAEALVQTLSQALEVPDDAAFVEAMFALRANWPVLMAKAENAHLRSQLQAPQTPRPQAPQPETAAGEPSAPTVPAADVAWRTTVDYVEHAKLDPQFRDLAADDWKQIVTALERTPYAFLRPATAEEAQYPGEVVFDVDALHAHLSRHVSTSRTARETAAKQAKLAAENARRTQPTVAAPPTVGAGRAPVAPGGAPKLESSEDVDAWLDQLTRGG